MIKSILTTIGSTRTDLKTIPNSQVNTPLVLTGKAEISFPFQSGDRTPQADFSCLHHYGYGAGRRMCPGIHLAERSMWRVTAKLLWAFEFEELPDKPIDVNAYTSSNLVRPLEYEVKVKPRSQEHENVIRRELTQALEFLSQYD
jgi:hypothetical protein